MNLLHRAKTPVDELKVRVGKDNAAESELFFRRALFILLAIFLALLAVAGRLAYLQVLNHDRFTTLADSNRIRLQPLPPTRGFIFDRNGVLLADNLASYHLEITREQVKDLDQTLAELRERITLTDADLERFRRLVRRGAPYNGVPLRFQLTDEEIAKLAIDLYRLPGVDIKADLTRRYPLGTRAVHVVGYVGRIDENELRRLDPGQYSGSTHIGKTGVEQSYEDVLRGRTGWQQVETNAEGRPLRVLSRTPPTPGQNIYLSIDIRLQAVAEKALEGYNGAIVAIDPRNGEVLALASQPLYDPNPFVNGIDVASYQKLNTSKDKPLLNRALRGMYPPGSTIKPLMALAGLDYGVVNRYSPVFCPGFYRLPGSSHRFRDWKRGGHGSVDMDRAIAQSCDVYFYDLALNIGIDRTHDFLDQFSMGRPTGIDLPGEKGGVLPSQAWKRKSYKQNWFAGDTLSAGIGQGYFLATPLQLAHAAAILSQRGIRFLPRVLYATEHPGTRVKTIEPPRPAPPVAVKNPRYWDPVINGMIHVVEGGTAHRIGIGAKYRIAGKTGTAQVFTLGQGEKYNAKNLAKHLLDHALFIAFAPVEEPRIAVAVIAEHGGGGSSTAAPLARKVMDAWLLNKYEESPADGADIPVDSPPTPESYRRMERNDMDRPNNGRFLNLIYLDLPLLLALLAVSGLGLVVLYSAGQQNQELVIGQAIRLGLGFTVMLTLAQLPPRYFRFWSPWIYLAGILLLLAVMVVGDISKGAQRWLDLGIVRFQPSEIMKLAAPMMMAWFFAEKPLPPRWPHLLGGALITAIPFILIAEQPDLGTALVVGCAGASVLFLAGLNWWLMAGLAGALSAAIPLFWTFVMHDYQRQRVLTFLNPESDPLGAGYHIIQSKIAIGSGGIYGKGWLNGTQSHLDFLPEGSTDFIFAAFSEEFGLVGGCLLLTLYFFIIARSLYMAAYAPDTYGRLLSGSLTLIFFIYAFVNSGMVSGLLPVVGLPLPLFSYGGTSLVTIMAGFGILMSIYSHRRPRSR